MDKFVIEGGHELNGELSASGSKNAALPILFASILTDEEITFTRVPKLKDIATTLDLLRGIGAQTSQLGNGNTVKIKISKLTSTEAPYDLVRTMRASILVLGPLLARERRAKVSLPGGCAIGTRPVDIHLQGFEKMGAVFRLEEGYIHASCPSGLQGAEIDLRFPSVGATENLLMAATLASGKTIIRNAACEPEIINLAEVLRAMGAKISGEGTSKITIDGVAKLHGAECAIIFDRIEAGTLLLAGAMTCGSVRVNDVNIKYLESYLKLLRDMGLDVEVGSDWIRVSATSSPRPIEFTTEPYPGMPTDLQAQLMALLAITPGESIVHETIFENRFMHVPELNRMGAQIEVRGGSAHVHGKPGCYSGATVMATDLRASASLVLAGLAAHGTTQVRRIYHLDRGYEELEVKLQSIGARVERQKE